MQESIVFLLRVQCRRKESSRSLSHLLMSFLFYFCTNTDLSACTSLRCQHGIDDYSCDKGNRVIGRGCVCLVTTVSRFLDLRSVLVHCLS